jgi:hypothetical protein
MNRRALGLSWCSLLLCLSLPAALSACGDDDAPPADVDAGDSDAGDAGPDDAGPIDAGPIDAGPIDAGPIDAALPDAGEVDATVCPDVDGDGHGAAPCGDDCNDTNVNVNPAAAELCNGGIDDDCNGLADLADGVCVPCPAGYTGLDGSCTDVDECAIAATCGGGRVSCVNLDGSYSCGCAAGYAAPVTGGICADIDECATGAPCGALATACINTISSYACSCLPGYAAPILGGSCADIDECALGTCGAAGVVTSCVNSLGSYACTCAAGYTAPASGAPCLDINECALGTPCGAGLGSCANTAGTYACTCNAGYAAPATGGTCLDIDECALGTDDCDRDPSAVCANTLGSFTCACPPGFTGTAHGVAGCVLSDASLSSLVPSAGALSPAFDSGTTTYTLALPPGTPSVMLTPSVAYPTHATITVDGVSVASGAASAPILLTGFAPVVVVVTVTTESGAVRTYTIVVGRGAAYLKASNTGAGDGFGWRVALSADGSTLAVGAAFEDSSASGVGGDQTNNTALDSGAVYVFTRDGAVWSQQAYVKASNTNAGDQFGYAVALSADGSTLAVGARGEASNATGIGGDQTNNALVNAGAVYVFARMGIAWSQQAYVKASNTGASDFFGLAIALSADGSALAVGAYGEASNAIGVGGDQTNNATANAGAVYVFARSGTAWSQEAYVKASNTTVSAFFGYAIALSSDGSTIAVGAYGENSNATGVGGDQTNILAIRAGAAYVFARAGTNWSQQAYIKASNTDAGDYFGRAVALSADGSTLAVSAMFEASNATGVGGDETNNGATDSGAVYVFTRAGTNWSQQAYIKASNTGMGDLFGAPLALSADGSMLAVGVNLEASNAIGIGGDQTNNTASGAGAVYAFMRVGSAWSQQAYIKASNTNAYDHFGYAAAVSSDGSTFAVGATGEASNATGIGGDQTNNAASGAGAVYVY